MTSTNVIGLDVVGAASSFFCVLVLLPVFVLVLICLPSMKVSAWLEIPAHVDWVMWTNLALWNTNGWDSTRCERNFVVLPCHVKEFICLARPFCLHVCGRGSRSGEDLSQSNLSCPVLCANEKCLSCCDLSTDP
eukprot:750080-Hanusia_phi.AAC.1